MLYEGLRSRTLALASSVKFTQRRRRRGELHATLVPCCSLRVRGHAAVQAGPSAGTLPGRLDGHSSARVADSFSVLFLLIVRPSQD